MSKTHANNLSFRTGLIWAIFDLLVFIFGFHEKRPSAFIQSKMWTDARCRRMHICQYLTQSRAHISKQKLYTVQRTWVISVLHFWHPPWEEISIDTPRNIPYTTKEQASNLVASSRYLDSFPSLSWQKATMSNATAKTENQESFYCAYRSGRLCRATLPRTILQSYVHRNYFTYTSSFAANLHKFAKNLNK